MALQILVSQVNGHSLCLPRLKHPSQNINSLDDLKQTIYRLEGINPEDQRIIYNGHDIENDQFCMAVSQEITFLPLQFSLRGGCCGGKGGFGSLLRSAKSVKKTTNFGSCRDINGRRLRDVDQEKRMAEWRVKQEQFQAEKKQKKSARSKRKEAPKPVEEDDDVKLSNLRKGATDNVHSAVEKGLEARKKQLEEKKRKREEDTNKPNIKLFESDSDSDSSDDEQPEKKKQRTEKELEQTPQFSTTITSNTTTTTFSTISTAVTTIDDGCTPSTPEETKDTLQGGITHTSEPLVEGGTKRTCDPEPIDLTCYTSATELESLGLDVLKTELMRLGLKIGGNLKQRAERLWSTKGFTPDQYSPSIKATNNTNKRMKR